LSRSGRNGRKDPGNFVAPALDCCAENVRRLTVNSPAARARDDATRRRSSRQATPSGDRVHTRAPPSGPLLLVGDRHLSTSNAPIRFADMPLGLVQMSFGFVHGRSPAFSRERAHVSQSVSSRVDGTDKITLPFSEATVESPVRSSRQTGQAEHGPPRCESFLSVFQALFDPGCARNDSRNGTLA
jgi:hypothetical protein